jgi:hypothetical protein
VGGTVRVMPDKLLISYAVPVHKRHNDFATTLPHVIAAANASPPVQIVVVDYGIHEPLEPIIEAHLPSLQNGNYLTQVVYRKRPHYHMAHARNLSVRASEGEYIVPSCADIIPHLNFFSYIRDQFTAFPVDFFHNPPLRRAQYSWIHPGIVVLRRAEFIAAGGYDERFEFYGKEDKELIMRLRRRNISRHIFDIRDYVTIIPTPWLSKKRNYRLNVDICHNVNNQVFQETLERQPLVANEGINWGEL